MKQYHVNEVFYTIQGEGFRSGEASIFVRFAHCNLACSYCDTEFESFVKMDAGEILAACNELRGSRWIVLTGGEPMQQVDEDLVNVLHDAGYHLAVETNGMFETPRKWFERITVSPKTAEHTLKVKHADEVKYVRHAGQGLPKPTIECDHRYLSPVWGKLGTVDRGALETCVELVKQHPWWKLSTQDHKWWGVR